LFIVRFPARQKSEAAVTFSGATASRRRAIEKESGVVTPQARFKVIFPIKYQGFFSPPGQMVI